jgi:hypothetical protein
VSQQSRVCEHAGPKLNISHLGPAVLAAHLSRAADVAEIRAWSKWEIGAHDQSA